jgi:prepilin-type N-terminal cleavage/methylation domain-containing protein/prepilin-type processing-associated H-X9-DG protein
MRSLLARGGGGRTDLKRRAFTLIELLVVIAIIGMLAGILFPVFSQARAKGRQVTCQNNLSQIGKAIALYQHDNDGYYVPAEVGHPEPSPTGFTGGQLWLEVVNPAGGGLLNHYLPTSTPLQCPSRQEPEARYTINGWSECGGDNEHSPAGRHDSEVVRPSNTLIVWEHRIAAHTCNTGQSGSTETTLDPRPALHHFESGHHGGFTALYCDGHVKRVTYLQLVPSWFTSEEDPD